MSKNNNDQNVLPEGKVLTTSVSRIIAKFGMIFAAVGLAVGILVMVFLNLGLHELLFGAESAATEIVAHNASDNRSSEGLKTIGVKDLGISFADYAMQYNGEYHELLADNTEKLPKGVTVSYANNKHKDVGTYKAVAIFSGEGYATEILEAEFKIVKADISGITFDSALKEYKAGTTHEILIKGNLPEGVEVSYSLNRAEEVGVYHATAVLYGHNYNNLVLEATLTVVDLTKLVKFDDIDEEAKAILFTYDKDEHTVELNTEAVLTEIVEKRNFKVTYDVNTFVNAGEYVVTATVSADGFTTFTVSVPVIVKQGDMEKVHGLTVNSSAVEYDETVKSVSYSELPENIKVDIKYYMNRDAEGKPTDEVDPSSVIDPHKYIVVLVFTDTDGNCETKTIEREFEVKRRSISSLFDMENGVFTYSTVPNEQTGAEEGRVRRLKMIIDTDALYETLLAQDLVITYTFGDVTVVATYTFNEENVVITYVVGEDVYTEEYYYGRIETEIPVDFTEVSVENPYTLKAAVKGNKYDDDAEIKATMTIKYATLSSGNYSVKNNQIVLASGKYQAPKYTAKNGVDVKFIYNNEEVEGFKYFGIYNVNVVFTKGNYQATKTVRYIVMFNPLIALIGLALGMLLGLLFGLLTSGLWIKKEKASRNHFRAPSAIVANARGGIICESYAKCDNSGCTGRLYLSSKSIEFYADDYKALKDNFLIDIDDVRNVDVIASNKIQVYARKETYVFTVPDGTAAEWVHEIIHA